MNPNTAERASAPDDVGPAADGDVVPIRAIAMDNGMFAPDDMAGFDEMLRGYLDGSLDQHRWIVAEDEAGRVAGAAYYAPEPFADRVWNLSFLAVQPHLHRSGIGTTFVAHIDVVVRPTGGGKAHPSPSLDALCGFSLGPSVCQAFSRAAAGWRAPVVPGR